MKCLDLFSIDISFELSDNSHEMSRLIFYEESKYLEVFAAAVVIDTLRVNI